MKLFRNSITVGFWTLISRIMGFIRDVLFAAILGTGPAAEAFLVAFALPNMFRRILAEGSLNLAFVPLYTKKIKDNDEADEFAGDVLSFLTPILIIIFAVAQLFMPFLVLGIASGFQDDGRFDLAVLYSRIAFPYILFIVIAALLSAILNSHGRFTAAAAAPIALNIFFIFALTISAWLDLDAGIVLAWTVPIAGIAQFSLLVIAVIKSGIKLSIGIPRISPDMKRLGRLALPVMIAGGVVQINLLVGRQVSSYFDGAVAWLSFADRLYQLPLGIIGIAIGIVLLPELSRKLHSGDTMGGQFAFNRAIEGSLALSLPAAAVFAVIPLPIVSVLFEREAFSHADAYATAMALAVYACGLPAFILQKIYLPLYYARENSRTPLVYAIISMVINIAVTIGLLSYFGYLAAAWGTTSAAWGMLILLVIGTRQMGPASKLDDRNLQILPRIIIASISMAGLVWIGFEFTREYFFMESIRYFALVLLILVGVVIYGLLSWIFRIWKLDDLKKALKSGL